MCAPFVLHPSARVGTVRVATTAATQSRVPFAPRGLITRLGDFLNDVGDFKDRNANRTHPERRPIPSMLGRLSGDLGHRRQGHAQDETETSSALTRVPSSGQAA